MDRFWRGLFGGTTRQALRGALEQQNDRVQSAHAAFAAMGCSVLTIEMPGGTEPSITTARLVDVSDGLTLFNGLITLPCDLFDVVSRLGGTRDIQDTLDLVLAQCESGTTNAPAEGEPPVFAIPARSEGHDEPVRWLSVMGTAVDSVSDGGAGQMSRLVLVLRDVTRNRQHLDDLERKLALMNRALDRAPFGLAVVDAEGLIKDSNTAFRRMTGGRSVHGHLFSDLFLPEDRSHLSSLTKAILQEGRTSRAVPAPLDMRLSIPEERILTLYANRTVIPEKDKPGILFHVLDSTERKRLESQFAQSQKMEAVGQLAGGIAHDFNNVLTAIVGFCDLLLQRHHPGDPSFGDVMQIQQNANRAAGLTRQLLAFSRQQSIRTRVVDVTDMLAELSNLLRRLLGETVELRIIHGRDLAPVKGDRGQLEQGLINLAVNARDAMDRRGTLIIQTDNFVADRAYQMRDQIMPPGDYVMITVTDTGSGMTPDILNRIFEPFFTTKEVGQGTGLGLAMVYGSITQMGGFVVVHSDGPGRGATFSLYLPRASDQERDAAEHADRAQSTDLPSLDDTGGERILLVEDEDAVRLFSARALRSKGYDVTEARTGEVALEILKDQSFDLMVTDMVMPKVDGATLIQEARKTMPDLPVICISGYTRETVAKEVAELPKVRFLSKPFSLKQLTTTVRTALESVARNGMG